jgi:hypothetical protein
MAQKFNTGNCTERDRSRVSEANFDDGVRHGGEQNRRGTRKPPRLRMMDPHQADEVASRGLKNYSAIQFGSYPNVGDWSRFDGCRVHGRVGCCPRPFGRGVGKICIGTDRMYW